MIPDASPDDLRVVFLTDLHLSASRRFYQDNWDMIVAWVNDARPDCVVVGGDLVLSDPDIDEDHAHAHAELRRLEVPFFVIPGNHDVGDNIVSGAMSKRVTSERRARWISRFGPDYWRHDVGEWTLIGVDAQILNGDGLADEDEQQAWLSRTVSSVDADRPIALFVHKPLFMDHPSEEAVQAHCLELAARRQLLAPFSEHRLLLIACGHKHQYRAFGHDGVLHVWGPSTGVVNFPPTVTMWGRREVGFVEFRLGQRATRGRVRQRLVGSDFLFRHESYIRIAEYGSVMNAPQTGKR